VEVPASLGSRYRQARLTLSHEVDMSVEESGECSGPPCPRSSFETTAPLLAAPASSPGREPRRMCVHMDKRALPRAPAIAIVPPRAVPPPAAIPTRFEWRERPLPPPSCGFRRNAIIARNFYQNTRIRCPARGSPPPTLAPANPPLGPVPHPPLPPMTPPHAHPSCPCRPRGDPRARVAVSDSPVVPRPRREGRPRDPAHAPGHPHGGRGAELPHDLRSRPPAGGHRGASRGQC